MKPPKFLRFWFPVIAYSAIIFYVSSLPNLKAPLGPWGFDKVLHVLEYMPYGFLVARAMTSGRLGWPSYRIWWGIFLFVSFYGLSDEVHQMFVVGRESSLGDLFADTIGAMAGSFIYVFLRNNRGWV